MYARGSSTLVAKDRYVSHDFAELEQARLWPRVWQIACTVDHVAEPGDWYEYRAGWISVLVVRGHDGILRAFQNVCRHRGNALCQGSGGASPSCAARSTTGRGTCRESSARCRHADGSDRSTTTTLELVAVQVGVWGRLVFVNLDRDAESLDEYLEGVPEDAAWANLDDFRSAVTTRTPVACNWKVAADGFSETYHVQGIHHEMLGSMDDVHATQHIWGRQSVSYQDYGVPSPRLGRAVSDARYGTPSSSRKGAAWARSTPNRARCRRSRTGIRFVT